MTARLAASLAQQELRATSLLLAQQESTALSLLLAQQELRAPSLLLLAQQESTATADPSLHLVADKPVH